MLKKSVLLAATILTLSAGIIPAQAVEFGVGRDGVYVGSDRDRYRDRHRGDRYRGSYNRYRECRTIEEHRTNRRGDDVRIRRRVCD